MHDNEIVRELITKEKNNYALVYNMFLDFKEDVDYKTGNVIKNKYSLTPDELYIYYYLYSNRIYLDNTTKINIDLISQDINLTSKKDKELRKNKNKPAILDVLMSLKEKKIIIFDDTEMTYAKLLNIEFYKFFQTNGQTHGHEQIEYDIFKKARSPKEFFILCLILYVKRNIPYTEISRRIGHSYKHVVKIIQEMSNDKDQSRILNKYSGKYFKDDEGNIKQETNTYEIRNDNLKFTEDRSHNWYNWKEKLTYNDYVIYKTTEDTELKAQAEKRIKALTKKKFNFKMWEEKWENKNERDINLEHIYEDVVNVKEIVVINNKNKRYKTECVDIDISEL